MMATIEPHVDNIESATKWMRLAVAIIGLMVIVSGIAVTYASVGDHGKRLARVEEDVRVIQMSGHKDHEDRLDVIENIVRRHDAIEVGYQKDIEQIKKDIASLVEEQKSQGTKSDEMLRILLGKGQE